MFLLTGEQMKQADQMAINTYGIPGLILMENAALSVIEVIKKRYQNFFNVKVVVLAGKGNNGGDGFAVARHLLRRGAEVNIFSTASLDELQGDVALNCRILHNNGITVNKITESCLPQLKNLLQTAQLVIDSLLGTGFRGKPRSLLGEVIALINDAPGEVLAVDIPSGVDATTGEVRGEAVKADITVTFASPKVGLLFYPGAAYCGKVFVADIGIPTNVMQLQEDVARVITAGSVINDLPPRFPDAHKGTYGRALLFAGSPGMTGAALLAARSVLRAGAGLVYVAAPGAAASSLESKTQEEVVLPLNGDKDGNYTVSDLEKLGPYLSKCKAFAFGPGTNVSEENLLFLQKLISQTYHPLVVDAGGLGALSLHAGTFPVCRPEIILTPHAGEMASLCCCSVEEVENNRLYLAREKAKEWGVTLVLKGAPTVVASPKGELFVNSTGNTSLSTAGTGDVLTGIITSFLAQGLKPLSSACCGVFIHGLAADLLLAKRKSVRGTLAGDFLEELPSAFSLLEAKSGQFGDYGPLRPFNGGQKKKLDL